MKLLIFLFLLAIFLPLGAQLRTRYTPLPIVRPVVRRWRFQGQRRAIQIVYVRM